MGGPRLKCSKISWFIFSSSIPIYLILKGFLFIFKDFFCLSYCNSGSSEKSLTKEQQPLSNAHWYFFPEGRDVLHPEKSDKSNRTCSCSFSWIWEVSKILEERWDRACKGCHSAKFNKNNAATSNSALKIKDKLDNYLEPGLSLIIKKVEKIERPKSGKIKHFYSELKWKHTDLM